MRFLYSLLLIAFFCPLGLLAQDAEPDSVKVVDKPERPAFESNFLIDNPTDKLYLKNSLEVVFQHRFGTISGGENDLLGIYGAANIRIGVAYTLHERVQIGFGTEKNRKLQDFNLKLGLLQQTRSGRIPVNVSYYGNVAIDARKKENFALDQHRYSYFHSLIISRRFSPNLSLQVVPSLSHFNAVPEGAQNDVFGLAFGGRYKVTPNTAITMEYSMPMTDWDESFEGVTNPTPGFSLGMEFVTSSHAFQVYLSSLKGITPQANYFFNDNQFFDGFDSILLGFTITRIYNF
jgi:hypothetical protein